MQSTALQLMLQAGPVVKAVLLILLFFSVSSWAIIFYKHRQLSAARKQDSAFLKALRAGANIKDLSISSRKLTKGPAPNIFRALYSESGKGKDALRRTLKRLGSMEADKLESHLGFLATTGSVTPFIGLFGTVWGIMDSFRGIGATGAATLAIVAPGIAEALIATAMGLAAAIPAVIAYNFYLGKSGRLTVEMEDVSEEILDAVAGEAVRQ